ncbi:MAG: MarR family transcriptional regulator [Candidatus Auribacterota bacterium]|jgi:DNA-binding MarR family transcriptional regulator|nr:MarR family transcriptional regulator [Candidatus Auribacterota bacterium]
MDIRILYDAILTAIFKLGYQIDNTALGKFLAGHGITRNQLRMLMLLQEYPDGLSCKEIGDNLALKKTNVAFFIKKLELDKLVTRNANRPDKRFAVISLSDHGKQTLDKIANARYFIEKQAFADFSETELLQFTAYLKKLSANLENLSG